MAYVINQKNCSCCHRCRMECPVQAITFRNDKYWIDPDKCIDCGTCEGVCHNGAISNPDCPKPKPEPHEPMEMACDVCVIGAGGAGLVAACKAQDMGAKVILLEKNHEIGGSAWYAIGFSTNYSKLHQQAGKKDPRERMYNRFLQKTQGYNVDPELLKRLFEANADWIDWMVDEHNLEDYFQFNPKGNGPLTLLKKVNVPWNDQRIDAAIGPGGGGWLICTVLEKAFLENGGTLLCSTAAKHLVTNESGEICGVVAEDAGGTINITCKSAVVASGAFTHNKEIMDKMQPLFYDDEGKQPIHIFTCPTCTGDGITMCEELGADVDYKNRRVNMFGPVRHPYPAVTLNGPNGPMFRYDGQRYIEDMKGMTEVCDLAYDAKRYLWKITDDGNFEATMNHRMGMGRDDNGVDVTHFLKDWRKVLKEEELSGSVVMADTLEELAKKLGYDPVKFAADIAEYNRAVLNPNRPPMMPMMGLDPEDIPGQDDPDREAHMSMMMGPKEAPIAKGPFYALKMIIFHENAMGGMVIDKNTSVLRDGKPITGLYAAGDTTRGIMVPGDIGVQYIETVFTALTYALNSGYISGEEAARHALK
ncbi:MAG: FAD-dependent oxidoreductase [Faecousia sp.]